MDYNKLKTFTIVAERSSLTEAAAILGRTQSAITQQVQLLEEDLGFSLFDRKHGRIYLTREGERMFDFAGKLLGGLDDAVSLMKNELTAVEGTLRLGVIEDYGISQLSPAIAAFKRLHPRIRINMTFGTSEWIEAQLLSNQIDMGILILLKDKTLFSSVPLSTDDHLLCTSQAYFRNHGPLKTVEQIIAADLVDFTDDFLCIATWIRKNCSDLLSTLLHRKPDLTLPSHSGAKALILAGYGIAALPRYLIAQELEDGSIIQLMKSTKPIRAGMDLVVRKKATERLFEKLFKEFLLEFVQRTSR